MTEKMLPEVQIFENKVLRKIFESKKKGNDKNLN
jgi:hypothetical protein